jgi:hypothetical protein
MLQRVILQHVTLLTIASVLALPAMAWAQAEAKSAANPTAGPTAAESGNPAPMNTGSTPGTAPAAAAPTPPYAATLKDAKSVSGLLQLHHKGNNLYVELMPGDYSSEYIVMIAISRGIAQDPIFGGMTWSNGDDWVWQFRKVGDNVHVVRRNVRFKADANSPEARAVQNAYNDSVLFSMPATMKGPKGGDLIDLTSVFLSDLPQISEALPPGFMFSSQR